MAGLVCVGSGVVMRIYPYCETLRELGARTDISHSVLELLSYCDVGTVFLGALPLSLNIYLGTCKSIQEILIVLLSGSLNIMTFVGADKQPRAAGPLPRVHSVFRHLAGMTL